MLQSARKLTEHLGMRSYDPILGTRSVVGRNWFTRLCTWLNFDIFVHGPHHRHPRIAHHRLRGTLNEFRSGHPDIDVPVFDSYGAALIDMMPSLWRNPGVGMNVGAPAPRRTRIEDCDSFVRDVNEEILAPEESGT
jgi:hypothetical protein